jgi:signal transduction histidine kinase
MDDMPKTKDAVKYRMPTKKGLRHRILLAVVIFCVYFFFKYINLYLSASNSTYPLISISMGFAIAMLILFGYEYIVPIGLAALALNLYNTGNPGLSVCLTVSTATWIYLSTYLINRWAGGAHVLESIKNSFKFILLVVFVGAGSTALTDTITRYLLSPAAYKPLVYLVSSWFSSVTGVLIIAPIILLYFTQKSDESKRTSKLEFALILIASLVAGTIIFGPVETPLLLTIETHPYLCILLIICAAVRTSRERTAYVVALIAAMAVVGTLLGYSPFLVQFQINLDLQVFLFFIPLIGIVVSVILFERNNAIGELMVEKNTLSSRVEEKANELLEIHEKESRAKASSERKAWKKLDRIKSIFLSVTGHELRTPITPIIGQLELLQTGCLGKLNRKQEEAIRMALRNAHRLDKLTRDFLDLTRIQASILEFDYTRVNLKSLIRNLVKEESNYLQRKDIRIITRVERLPKVLMDSDRTMRVLKNLLDNAKKFSPEKSKITVTVGRREGMLLFSVKDAGVGISKENKKKIFTPFFQADGNATRSYGGVGLGLAICKGIVESSGGKIWFESNRGKGTTFYFTIPLKPLKRAKQINMFSSR